MALLDILRRQKGIQIKEIGKPIEDMTIEELEQEMKIRIDEINNNNDIDERTFQIIDYMFNTAKREKNINVTRYIHLISKIKNFELKKQLTEKFAKYIPVSKIEEIKGAMHQNLVWEQANKKDNSSHDAQDDKHREIDTLIGILYSQNIEEIDDLEKVVLSASFSTFYEIYNVLPKEKQLELVKYKLNSKIMLYRDDEKYIDLIDGQKEKLDLLISVDSWEIVNKILEKNEELTSQRILEYFKEIGKFKLDLLPHKFYEHTELSAEELIEELSYYNDNDSRQNVISYYFYNMSKEEQLKFISTSNVEKELVDKLSDSLIIKLTLDEKIDFLKTLTDEQQQRYIKSFVPFYKTEPDQFQNYFNQVLTIITDRKAKDLFVLSVFRNYDLEHSYIINAIKNGNEEEVNEDILLNLTDEELIRLYEDTNNDLLKAKLVKLSRNSNYDFFDLQRDIDDDAARDLEPLQHIIVNDENYFSLIINSKGKNELLSLLELDYPLKAEEKNQILDMIKDKYSFENGENKELLKKAILFFGLEDYKKYIGIIKTNQIYVGDFWEKNKITQKDLVAELGKIVEMKEVKESPFIKDYISELISNYLYNPKSDENIDVSKKYTEIANLMSEICLKDEINDEVRHVFLEEFFENSYSSVIQKNEIIKKLILTKKIDIKEKYWLLSKAMFYKKDINEIRELFAAINKEASTEEYNEIFASDDSLLRYDLFPFLGNQIVYEKLKELYKNNPNIIDSISRGLLSENVITKIDSELLEFWSRYRDSLRSEQRSGY